MEVYHYTIADRLVKIMIDGFLKLTPREESPLLHEGEMRCVWFTTSKEWDKTAFYGHRDDVLDNAGRIRITIDAMQVPLGLATANSHRLGDWDSLVWSADEVGVDYRDWMISPSEVKVEDFERVELWLEKEKRWHVVPWKRMCGES